MSAPIVVHTVPRGLLVTLAALIALTIGLGTLLLRSHGSIAPMRESFIVLE
jgi:hypothetical protein